MSFAEWFVTKCNEKKVSPTAVGAAVGVSPASASYWASGRSVPKKTTLAKIENYFGEKFDDTISIAPDGEKTDVDRELESLLRNLTDDEKKFIIESAKNIVALRK